MSVDKASVVEREYATAERHLMRRLDRTALLGGGDEPWWTALRAIAEARPTRVLDAGSGSGDFASAIAAPELVCVDQSEAMVAAARERGLDARVGRIEELPFPAGWFDVVVCNWVLYHLADVDRGLIELVRVLRPGGRLVAAYSSRRHLAELWGAVGHEWPEDFSCETGLAVLERHFANAERRETSGEAVWESREELQTYLDAYAELAGPLRAPEGPYPFRATRRNCVFVAEKAA